MLVWRASVLRSAQILPAPPPTSPPRSEVMAAYAALASECVVCHHREQLRALLGRAATPGDVYYGDGLRLACDGVVEAAALAGAIAAEFEAEAVVSDSLLRPWAPGGFRGGAAGWPRPR